MDIFTPVVPEEKLHPNFIRVSTASRDSERAVVQSWAEGFPDRDGKIVKEFQTTFNSTFWEIYLYALFREYGYNIDWEHASPDFHLRTNFGDAIIEAVTANAAEGATPEWEREAFMTYNVENKNFWPLNHAAIIRLSNALLSKLRKYQDSYRKLPHVRGLPYVVAVAPFEQPDFQYQYDRAMRALLYDDYVDETAYFKNPEKFPFGPTSVKLGFVKKNENTDIELGIFHLESWSDVSAVVFSCVATWGKAVSMSTRKRPGEVVTSWGTDSSGRSEKRIFPIGEPSEQISDGLQIFHNPLASRPLPLDFFRRKGVVQHFLSPENGWMRENYDDCLQWRLTHAIGL